MRRIVALFLAVSLLALPSAAMAQSAGDEQYADPFGQAEEPSMRLFKQFTGEGAAKIASRAGQQDAPR